MLIIRNLNVISVQCWTYLYEGEMSEETMRPLKVKKKLMTNYGCVSDRKSIFSKLYMSVGVVHIFNAVPNDRV